MIFGKYPKIKLEFEKSLNFEPESAAKIFPVLIGLNEILKNLFANRDFLYIYVFIKMYSYFYLLYISRLHFHLHSLARDLW